MELVKPLIVKYIGHVDDVDKDSYAMTLETRPEESTFCIRRDSLESLNLKPSDFLEKYFKVHIGFESAKGGQLYPFKIERVQTVSPACSIYDPKDIHVLHHMELRQKSSEFIRPGGWFYLPLTYSEYNAAKILRTGTCFNITDYRFEEIKSQFEASGDNRPVIRDVMRDEKILSKHNGEYVAVLNSNVIGYNKDPLKFENMEIEQGTLSIQKVVKNNRREVFRM